MKLKSKREVAMAAAVCTNSKRYRALKRLELSMNCDYMTCGLWQPGVGCTVGYCRRTD